MSTHARALGTDMAVEAHLDVGDTAKATRKHYRAPPFPGKTRQSNFPTPWAPFWPVFGPFRGNQFWIYFAIGPSS